MLFDLYVPTDGWLHRLDPRVKIALVLGGAALFVVFNSVAAQLALLLAVHLILLTSKVPPGQIGWVWRQLRRVLIIIVVVFPLFSRLPGPALFEVGPLTVTWTGLLAGVTTATRVIGMSLLFFVILFTTRQNDLVRGLVRLGLPFEWGLTLAIALRYIPSFSHAIVQIQEAQAARGWQVERGDLWGRLRGVAPVLVALIVDVLRTGDTLGMALAVRGVGSDQPRSVWRDIRFGRDDWLALALLTALLVALLYARFGLGIGAALI